MARYSNSCSMYVILVSIYSFVAYSQQTKGSTAGGSILILAIAALISFAVCFMIAFIARRRIKFAIALIKESSRYDTIFLDFPANFRYISIFHTYHLQFSPKLSSIFRLSTPIQCCCFDVVHTILPNHTSPIKTAHR